MVSMHACTESGTEFRNTRYYLDQPIITLILTLIFSGFCMHEKSAQANKLIIQLSNLELSANGRFFAPALRTKITDLSQVFLLNDIGM